MNESIRSLEQGRLQGGSSLWKIVLPDKEEEFPDQSSLAESEHGVSINLDKGEKREPEEN